VQVGELPRAQPPIASAPARQDKIFFPDCVVFLVPLDGQLDPGCQSAITRAAPLARWTGRDGRNVKNEIMNKKFHINANLSGSSCAHRSVPDAWVHG
jgi:hypothetical protein